MALKLFFSYEQQIEELRNKGIIIDYDEGLRFLQNVNYYRLSAFFLPYKSNLKGVLFSRIVRLYEFDSKLRALLVPLIETIEIRFRSRIAYIFSERYGAEGYLESSSFSSRHDHEAFIAHIKKNVSKRIVNLS